MFDKHLKLYTVAVFYQLLSWWWPSSGRNVSLLDIPKIKLC